MDFGLNVNLLDGKALSELVARQWGIPLGVRPSRRLFRQPGFPHLALLSMNVLSIHIYKLSCP